MDKRKKVLISTITVLAVLASFTIASSLPVVYLNTTWALTEGQVLVYRVTQYESTSTTYAALENTSILVNITNLPQIAGLYTPSTFLESVVKVDKAECMFENGTAFEYPYTLITTVFSWGLLPNATWDVIDAFFVDVSSSELPLQSTEYTWITREDDGLFLFAHEGSSYHGGQGWRVWFNMSTGLLVKAYVYNSYYWGDGSNPFTYITLELQQ
jgi:hypothetical protein